MVDDYGRHPGGGHGLARDVPDHHVLVDYSLVVVCGVCKPGLEVLNRWRRWGSPGCRRPRRALGTGDYALHHGFVRQHRLQSLLSRRGVVARARRTLHGAVAIQVHRGLGWQMVDDYRRYPGSRTGLARDVPHYDVLVDHSLVVLCGVCQPGLEVLHRWPRWGRPGCRRRRPARQRDRTGEGYCQYRGSLYSPHVAIPSAGNRPRGSLLEAASSPGRRRPRAKSSGRDGFSIRLDTTPLNPRAGRRNVRRTRPSCWSSTRRMSTKSTSGLTK